ncbi:MAG: glycosyltransferase family 39 protein [bacterium]|nr:glycosyltransferase family 39 protein [bacterium]
MFSKKKFWFLYFLMLALELLVAGIILSRFGFIFYQGGDSPGYMLLAKNLVEHGTLSLSDTSPYIPSNIRTPGYPLFLAIIYFIFHSFVPAIFLGALVSAFAAPLIYLIAREIFSEKIAFGAGVLAAIEPLGLFLGASIITEGIFTPVLLLFTFYFIRYLKPEKNSYLWYSSALLGAATLIRPIMFYFWPLVIPIIIYKMNRFGWRVVLKNALIFVAIFLLVLSPWLVRNKISLNSWQVAGLQGYVFFIDHYGAVLRYLGEAGPLSDVQDRAWALAGPDKIFTSEGSDILFKTAFDGVKQHKLIYANIYAKSLISFFVANGYKSLFIDILGVPARAPFVPFELFLRFDFKSIFKTMAGMDFVGALIYFGGKIFWIAASGLFLISLIYLLAKHNFKMIRAEIIFIAIVIFYFALITGPTAVGGGRTKAPINGLILIFAVFGFYKFLDFFRKKII